MAEAPIVFFLDRLGRLLLQEGNHLSKVQEHVEWIQKELESMVAFLKDADKRQQRDELVAAWVRQVRNLVYDAEDIIDEYVTQMNALRWYSSSLFKYFYVKHHVGNQIIKIKQKVIEVNARKDRYGFRGLPDEALAAPPSTHGGVGGTSYRAPGAASPLVQVEDIVGIEDDVEQLIKMLLEGNRRDRIVISVFGMGGLGKTTLVKEVFKKAKMKFDCYSWGFVSQTCTSRDALTSILYRFMESRGEPAIDVMDTTDEGILQERTHNYLQDKKFLLALDDIWDNRLWEEIKHSFPPKRGQIIFTTRIRDIASTDEENFHIYDLQPWPIELAWQIFCKKAFRANKICPEDLKEFAEAIVRRCGGLPLAVVAIGGLLATRGTNLLAWQSVLRTLDWEVSQHHDLERLNNPLLFSYNYLPFYLKHCFLHVGLFPEDYNIGRKRLIRTWIAEGFVKEIPGKTLEEVANYYFMQLIDRSMIQAVTLHARDVVKASKVHDLMRDIANHMLQEEKFGAVLVGGESIIQERQRRLAIYDNADNIPPNISKLNLRSLLMFNRNEVSSSVLQKMLEQLKLARVLDLQGVPLEKLPDEIGELIHLRYLGLRGTLIESLPKSLKNLRNLQTLDIRKTNVRCLPAGSNKLKQLRHLLLSSFRDREKGFLKIPQGRISFLSPKTLSGVEADEDLMKELKGHTSLRKLSIRGITGSNSNELCNSLEGLTNLRSLTVVSESPGEQGIQIESLNHRDT
ncbi:hypothetical protein M9H77_29796 [Catharanthus roseus]|uniref:Uncharacterized protein n=1 Tax=Catharanthus roseus TaxID=4058 RepID=A0ACB9ZW84_CATRO|nr:hypothetical protein M9H77_29796 [Catharanthus roseus]